STLCHEFMHHLDVTALGFPNSFHTVGFYQRTHRLYLAAIGHPYYPLKWRRVGFDSQQIIDWQETRRLGAKVLGRTKVRGTPRAGAARRRQFTSGGPPEQSPEIS